MKTQNWTTTKLVSLVILVTVLIISVLFLSIISLKSIQKRLNEVVDVDIPLSKVASEIEIIQFEQHNFIEHLWRNDLDKKTLQENFLLFSKRFKEQVLLGLEITQKNHIGNLTFHLGKIQGSLLYLEQEQKMINKLFSTYLETNNKNLGEKNTMQLHNHSELLRQQTVLFMYSVDNLIDKLITTTRNKNYIFVTINIFLGFLLIISMVFLVTVIVLGVQKGFKSISSNIQKLTTAISKDQTLPNLEWKSVEFISLATDLSHMLHAIHESKQNKDNILKELKNLATLDKLTGVFNRCKWDEVLENEINRSHRNKVTLSLIVLDIDFFKKINDNYGHDTGDKILVAVAKLLKENIRKSDYLFRIGGEEFTILVPDATVSKAQLLAQKLCEVFALHTFEHVPQVTISAGVTQLHSTDSKESFFKRADQALYRAKESGRNCSVSITSE